MLAKCANPDCSHRFLYLHEGKLFEIEIAVESDAQLDERRPYRRVEFFWLCSQCSTGLTVVNDKNQGIHTIPIDGADDERRSMLQCHFRGWEGAKREQDDISLAK
jgi:hypothetical protein